MTKRKVKKSKKSTSNSNKNSNKNVINIKIGSTTSKRKRTSRKSTVKKVEGVSSVTPQPYYAPPQQIIRQPLYSKNSDYDVGRVRNDAFNNPEISTATLNTASEIHDTPHTSSLSSLAYNEPNHESIGSLSRSRSSTISSLTEPTIHSPQDMSLRSRQSYISTVHSPQDMSLSSYQSPLSVFTPNDVSLSSYKSRKPESDYSSVNSQQDVSLSSKNYHFPIRND